MDKSVYYIWLSLALGSENPRYSPFSPISVRQKKYTIRMIFPHSTACPTGRKTA